MKLPNKVRVSREHLVRVLDYFVGKKNTDPLVEQSLHILRGQVLIVVARLLDQHKKTHPGASMSDSDAFYSPTYPIYGGSDNEK